MTCTNCGNTVPDTMKFCPKCGTPVANSRYSPPASPVSPAWQPNTMAPPPKQKSGVGKILLIVGIVLVLLVAGIGVAIYFGVRSYITSTKSSAAYALAESTLRSSQAVREKMGEIKNVGVPIGAFKEDADGTGFAGFVMSVEGEKATGQYAVEMARSNHVWRIMNGTVKLMNGVVIRVVDPMDATHSDEPDDAMTVVNENLNANTTNANNSNDKPGIVSGGVLNGKATSLPKPPYPASAKAAHASGTVVVAVTIDEEGKVISASAVSGHPLLRPSAVAAARQARFTPTMLAGTPVKVSGVINYNFVAEP